MTQRGFGHQVALRIALATQIYGRTGWLGLALCVLAMLWFANAWRSHQADISAPAVEPVLDAPMTPQGPVVQPERMTLARQDEQSLVLTQIQQVAVSQGLGWTAADYKLVPASEASPMALEVRCTLKGDYPRLRATLAQWLQRVPGLAIRDLAMNRPSSEVADVEAKLHIVIFMSSDAPEAKP